MEGVRVWRTVCCSCIIDDESPLNDGLRLLLSKGSLYFHPYTVLYRIEEYVCQTCIQRLARLVL